MLVLENITVKGEFKHNNILYRVQNLITTTGTGVVKVNNVSFEPAQLTEEEIADGTENTYTIFNMSETGKLEIYGGTYQLETLTSVLNNLVVYGGTFDEDVSQYCAEGYECVLADDVWMVFEKDF